MVRPSLRTRALRRVYVKAPSGVRLHFKTRRQAKTKCRLCDTILSGVPHGTHNKIRKNSKTQKRPSRPFGGNLCSKCTRKELVNRARMMING